MDIHKPGLNIFVIDKDTNPEDLPKEFQQMLNMVDSIVGNTVRLCSDQDIHITLLPSIYLHAFMKVTPLVVDSIVKDQDSKQAQLFLNGLKMILDGAFEVKKK